VRNTVIFWIGVIAAPMTADAIGLPGWVGFVAALLVFAGIGHELAKRALRWRLGELMRQRADPTQRPSARP
jgi:NADH:ubiquinone oxidoreductase subunit 4 (subunit M)